MDRTRATPKREAALTAERRMSGVALEFTDSTSENSLAAELKPSHKRPRNRTRKVLVQENLALTEKLRILVAKLAVSEEENFRKDAELADQRLQQEQITLQLAELGEFKAMAWADLDQLKHEVIGIKITMEENSVEMSALKEEVGLLTAQRERDRAGSLRMLDNLSVEQTILRNKMNKLMDKLSGLETAYDLLQLQWEACEAERKELAEADAKAKADAEAKAVIDAQKKLVDPNVLKLVDSNALNVVRQRILHFERIAD